MATAPEYLHEMQRTDWQAQPQAIAVVWRQIFLHHAPTLPGP